MASGSTLTRAALSGHLMERLDCTRRDADLLVNTFFGSISEALLSGEGVELRGFGSFRLRGRASRLGRNPKDGSPIHVPPKTVVHFRVGKELRSKLVAGGTQEHDAQPPEA